MHACRYGRLRASASVTGEEMLPREMAVSISETRVAYVLGEVVSKRSEMRRVVAVVSEPATLGGRKVLDLFYLFMLMRARLFVTGLLVAVYVYIIYIYLDRGQMLTSGPGIPLQHPSG